MFCRPVGMVEDMAQSNDHGGRHCAQNQRRLAAHLLRYNPAL